MKIISRIAIIFSILYFGVRALADVTPSTAILLKSSETAPEVNLESGRYTIKSTAKSEEKAEAKSEVKVETKSEAKVEAKAHAKSETKVVAVKPVEAPKPAAKTPEPVTEENFVQKLQDIVLGDQDEAIRYRESLHPEDRRQNIIELQFAPALMYLDSTSKYSYRNFSSSGSGMSIGAQIWTSPFFAITSSYFITLASDIKADPAGDRRLQVDHRLFDVGFKFRKFYNLSRKSPVTSVSVKYDEYQMILPKKETGRTRLRTTGVALGLDAKIPSSVTHAWTFGTEVVVRPKVTEEKTDLDLSSGKNPTSQTYKFFVGSEYSFSRNQSLFLKLSHRYDKSVYEDAANKPDPLTGVAPTGVSVNQGITMFELGFTWGG